MMKRRGFLGSVVALFAAPLVPNVKPRVALSPNLTIDPLVDYRLQMYDCPTSRLARARATLPSGYQFGDAEMLSSICSVCGRMGHAYCATCLKVHTHLCELVGPGTRCTCGADPNHARGEYGASTVLGKICERCGHRSIERDERGEFCFVCDNGESWPA